jgi:Ca-activated chloride channel homolog
MEMFRFANPEFFWGLLIIPILTLLFIWSRILRKRAIRKFGNEETLKLLMPSVSGPRPVVKFIILQLAIVSIIIGIARPQFGSKLKKTKREGIELFIALDVSNSMLAEDIKPNRLDRAIRAITRLTDRLKDDKIGLIVFAGDAYIQLPLTTDYNSAKLFLSSVTPDMVPKPGTAIGSAIDLAVKSFTPDTKSSKAIVIITDGENHEDDPVAAAKAANEKGVVVHSIGMGLPQGVPIPLVANGQSDYRKDKDGKVVITKLDEQMLQQISAAGKGIYVRANNAQVGLDNILDEINAMQKSEMEARTFSEYEDQFQYFFALGLILMMLELLILERKNKYLRNFRLFSQKQGL